MQRKKIQILVLLVIFFFISTFFSCKQQSKKIPTIKLFDIPKISNQSSQDYDPYKIYNSSILRYKSYFIYFYDINDKIFYKFSKAGDQILRINNLDFSEQDENNEEIDRKYLESFDRNKITTKIARDFPFPDVLDFYVGEDACIYFKFSVDHPEDLEKFYLSENQKIVYLELEESAVSTLINPESEWAHVFFAKFNKYGDLEQIILNTEEDKFFSVLTDFTPLKNGKFILSRQNPNSGNYDLYLQSLSSYDFILLNDKYSIENKIKFTTLDLPLTKEEKEKLYQYFIIKYLISPSGDIYFYTTFFDKNLAIYSKIFEIEQFNLEGIRAMYYRALIAINQDTERKVNVHEEFPIGIDEYSHIFYIMNTLKKEDTRKLSISDRSQNYFLRSDIYIGNILSELQYYVGEDGILIAYAEKGDRYEIYYWATDLKSKQYANFNNQ